MTRVALVHDWLVAHRGGERVLAALAELYPEAPIYTLVVDPARIDRSLARRAPIPSWIQSLPGAPARFRRYLPLFPLAAQGFPLRDFDLVISTSHCVVHGLRLAPGQRHLCYVHTPPRYFYDQLPLYLPRPLRPAHRAVGLALWPWRQWDRHAAQRPTHLLANSNFVAQRIQRLWGRVAPVVYPPVDTEFFGSAQGPPSGPRQGFLILGAPVPYKRVEVAVRWARLSGAKLTVVGKTPEALRRQAPPQVRFVDALSADALRKLMQQSEGLLQVSTEDFGIAPVEAMAAGCPVVAYARGGALETVVEGETGVFFDAQTPAAIQRAVRQLRRQTWDPARMLAHARRFGRARFLQQLQRIIDTQVLTP